MIFPVVFARRLLRAAFALAWLTLGGWVATSVAWGAGVTIITHGLNGDVDDWVISMGDQIGAYPRLPGTTFSCYEIYFTETPSAFVLSQRRLGGSEPTNSNSGELIIKLDWRQLANNSYSTFEVAEAVVPGLLQPGFIPALGGRAIAELPLHLVGHSRGGSLISEMARLLGKQGVWVDHQTTLDPHPLNNDGFFDFPYTVVDATVAAYQNVLFADNVYQTLDFIAHGESVPGGYNRRLTSLSGGYSGFGGSHSDVHLWYHGTIDWRTPTTDSSATITSTMRGQWWTTAESNGMAAGFLYSRIGGGNRLSMAEPAGAGTGRIRDGYNKVWDLGGGTGNNRTVLPSNDGSWPNLLRCDLLGSNSIPLGQSAALQFAYQSGQPGDVEVQFFLDADANPYDGPDREVLQLVRNATGVAAVSVESVAVLLDATNSTPGTYFVYARIWNGAHARYLYAPQQLTITEPVTPPLLYIVQADPGAIHLVVEGPSGYTAVVEATTDFSTWVPISTNTFSGMPIEVIDRQALSQRFYRAQIVQ